VHLLLCPCCAYLFNFPKTHTNLELFALFNRLCRQIHPNQSRTGRCVLGSGPCLMQGALCCRFCRWPSANDFFKILFCCGFVLWSGRCVLRSGPSLCVAGLSVESPHGYGCLIYSFPPCAACVSMTLHSIMGARTSAAHGHSVPQCT
jgi:hypothetical protein